VVVARLGDAASVAAVVVAHVMGRGVAGAVVIPEAAVVVVGVMGRGVIGAVATPEAALVVVGVMGRPCRRTGLRVAVGRRDPLG
jgi:hypothetical protein